MLHIDLPRINGTYSVLGRQTTNPPFETLYQGLYTLTLEVASFA